MSDARRTKLYRLDRARGVDHTPLPAREVRAHVRRLRAAGLTARAIAEAAHCSPTTVRDIAAARTRTVRRAVAARLLTVTLPAAIVRSRPCDRIPSAGAVRRVRALLAIGHSHATITAAAGGHDTSHLARNPRRWVFRDVHEGVVRAYDALAMTPGTSKVSRTRAAAAGYAPPLAWDDDTIDDPKARPRLSPTPPRGATDVDEIAVQRALDGIPTRLTRAEREQAIPVLAARGWSDDEIGRACGCTDRTVFRIRKALDIPSTWKDHAA